MSGCRAGSRAPRAADPYCARRHSRAGLRLLAAVLVPVLAACSKQPADTVQGYGEGEYVWIASPYAGALERLAVTRGEQVRAGATLFVLEHAVERAALAAAEAKAQAAAATIANLSTGHRKAEVDALRAQLDAAAASLKLAQTQLDQNQRLHASGFLSKGALDVARANYERDAAQFAQMQAQMRTGLQSLGRTPEIEAAKANLDAARAEVEQARTRLSQKTGVAPADALVQDTFYRQGEWVAAGSPVVSLLPPGNLKVRFFVRETVVGGLKIGDPVTVSCDGCPAPLAARITYVASQAEYTPPVIYSRDSRAKLVFMVEARPEPGDVSMLRPGQPVDVRLQGQ